VNSIAYALGASWDEDSIDIAFKATEVLPAEEGRQRPAFIHTNRFNTRGSIEEDDPICAAPSQIANSSWPLENDDARHVKINDCYCAHGQRAVLSGWRRRNIRRVARWTTSDVPPVEVSALVYPKLLEGDEPVTCASCGELVSTYAELKRRFEPELSSNSVRVALSGC
jgi:hypothetical protein